MLDKLQRDAQRHEMEPGNTSPTLFIGLSLLQAAVVGFLASSLSWRFQIAGACGMCGHWIGFVISQLISSDKYFDITEDVTLFATLLYIYHSIDGIPSHRQQLVFGFALIWCTRLCAFVGYRVLVRGSDWRFDKLITDASYNFFGWTSGGTWCFFNCFCLWMLADGGGVDNDHLNILDFVGISVFIFGFTVEIVSDIQKYNFNSMYPSGTNKQWIESGLWAYSRHPNYAGEMILWLGISIICMSENPTVYGVVVSAVTPIWSCFFLVFTSLMLLEKRADKRWGGEQAYQAYLRRVPVLFPWS